jgi:aminoglycoside 2'-N-acetyltransferase I
VAELRIVTTDELSEPDLEVLRGLMLAAFEDEFSEEDWANTLGGRHAIVTEEGIVVAHAALVERTLVARERALRAGYVEGVATASDRRRQGHGATAMRALHALIADEYDVGGLSTGAHRFYERLGWEHWQGSTFVDAPTGRQATPDDDDGVMVLRTARSVDLDLTTDLVCDWRPGDVW